MMDDLRRELAPISSAAWEEIDNEAKGTLELHLAGRKVADFSGPSGWDTSAVGLGRVNTLERQPTDGVSAALRAVQPLVELRAPFTLSREELGSGELSLAHAMVQVGLAKSGSEATRKIKGGGAYINNKRVEDIKQKLTPEYLASETVIVLRSGKKDFGLLRFKG